MLLSQLASSATFGGLELVSLLHLPVDEVRGDGTASDPGAGRAVFFGVPRAAEAVVVRVLVHRHRLVVDARLRGGGREAWLLGRLEVPACVASVREAAPQIANVVQRVAVIPAVRLPRQLEVASCRAALSSIPLSLVDGQGISSVSVGKLDHVAPDVDRSGRRVLPEMVEAVRIGGSVAWVGLHFAVGAPWKASLNDSLGLFPHALVVFGNLRLFFVAAPSITAFDPVPGELRHIRFLYIIPTSDRIDCEQG